MNEFEASCSRDARTHPVLRRARDLAAFVLGGIQVRGSSLAPEHLLARGLLDLCGGLAQLLVPDGIPSNSSGITGREQALAGIETSIDVLPACRAWKRMNDGDLLRIEKELVEIRREIVMSLQATDGGRTGIGKGLF